LNCKRGDKWPIPTLASNLKVRICNRLQKPENEVPVKVPVNSLPVSHGAATG